MALIRKSIWPTFRGSLLSDFFEDNHFSSSWIKNITVPAVDGKEGDKASEVELAAPGFNKNDFNISIEIK